MTHVQKPCLVYHDKCIKLCEYHWGNHGFEQPQFLIWGYESQGHKHVVWKFLKFPKEVNKPSYSIDMGKSGNINRFDPTDTNWATKFWECETLFRAVGQFIFFENITGFNPEVSHHFTQNFINGIVTYNTLKLELIKDLIDEATSVSIDGES